MAKEIDKIIQSKTAPKSNNVLWDDGENLKINRNGKWESAGGGAPMINITYANLVELRNNSKLIAGMQYRITDYVTTTAQENTRSAEHQFDVIVTADNENTLNEVARACVSEGDTYFTEHGAKLEAWQLWYSLDNDEGRFAWADAENGKGVIYRMIDEHNNDIPYDFKNIIYVFAFSFECTQYGVSHTYTKSCQVISLGGVDYYGYARTRTGNGPPPPPELLYSSELIPSTSMKLYQILDGVASEYTSATIDSVEIKEGDAYTFQGNGKDATLTPECHSNIIGVYIKNGVRILNDICFVSENSSLFCYSNSFGDNCYSNSFGNECYSNSFGNDCHSNSFGNRCDYNVFGNRCNYNSFGNDCDSNVFGNSCDSNSFGNGCYSNSFGNDCDYNVFGNRCNYNSFGNDSQRNELKAYYRYITFGEGVQCVTLQNNTEGGYENLVQNYRVANGIHGEYGNPLVVDVTRNMGCETFIGMDSNDKLKVFCLADLLNS